MAPKKKCSCCECTKKKKEKDCSQYPAGIQKEDLLWAYFVMRMVINYFLYGLIAKHNFKESQEMIVPLFFYF